MTRCPAAIAWKAFTQFQGEAWRDQRRALKWLFLVAPLAIVGIFKRQGESK